MTLRSSKLGEILVEEGLLTEGQLDLALTIQKTSKSFLGDIILKKEWVSEGQLAMALSRQFDLPFVELDFNEIDWNIPQHYTALVIDQHCFPCAQNSASLTVAIFNPLDAWTMSRIEKQAKGRHVKLVVATQTKIYAAISEFRKRALHENGRECA